MLWVEVIQSIYRPLVRRALVSVFVPVAALLLSLLTTHTIFRIIRQMRDALLTLLYWLLYCIVLTAVAGFYMRMTDSLPNYVEQAVDHVLNTNWTALVLGVK